MSETFINPANPEQLQTEAMRSQELTTVAEANSYITEVVKGAKSASLSEDGRQETTLPGVSFTREYYYPPSHDYQHDEVRIDYPNGSAVIASEFSGVTFLSMHDINSDGNYTMRTGQSADFPGVFSRKDTSHSEEKATDNFVELAQEFKARLEQRADNPEEFSTKNRLKAKLSRMAGRLSVKGS